MAQQLKTAAHRLTAFNHPLAWIARRLQSRSKLRLGTVLLIGSSLLISSNALALTDAWRHSVNNDSVFYDPNAVSCSSTQLVGSDAVAQAYNYFLVQLGGANNPNASFQAAAIVGNLQAESSLNPNAVNTSAGVHRGIAQWSSGRWAAMLTKFGSGAATSLSLQLQNVWWELNSSYSSSLSALRATTDVTSATISFEQTYEVAGLAVGSKGMNLRINYATQALKLNGGSTSATASVNNCTGQDTQYINGFTFYSQQDPAWRTNSYGIGNRSNTIGGAGCAPTSLAMAITNLTGKHVTPDQVSAYVMQSARQVLLSGDGTLPSISPVVGPHFGVKATPVADNVTSMQLALQQGSLLIAGGISSGNPFTPGGHYILIRATQGGKWLIADPDYNDSSRHPSSSQNNTTPFDPVAVASYITGQVYAISK
jgi:hypothetical protein